jgi:mRNA interferase MazF
MTHQRGDVVLVPFPFTDLTATKTRPAVVVSSELYHSVRSELLLAYVSSQVSKSDPRLDHVLVDRSSAGLPKPSFVRPKIAAIEPSLVVYHVGSLSVLDLAAVDQCLRQAFPLPR